ncbi:23S rRNA (guanosine(2251)-2'-O)-methyltransferase RlmB [Zhenhengia yiwuensis]|uniref:23S rRNA (guanosine(2251)-2'-O)-methyltransferase RlmB n=1 Tax=Zhenhengia yiwuensis TaxID=2763666 RepID=UPI001B46BB02|nr:23S rRNA (guanosine(2251)-2'-O)-methyltransferase RlmB [Zhenhengia yiwuensis]MBP3911893.1 23S rRNA (guanosine(2251)-2'-O)-methyltransferase RlmB [Niameybacter sp.]MDY3367131.1 23S rRNA (guanosine(2251)-2'-O)-methyltransferase RlmB [Zhenhengia yiwuensis]
MNLEQTTENRPAEGKKPFKKKPYQGKGYQGKKPFNKAQGEKVADGKKPSNKAQGEKGGEGEKATNRRPSYNQRPARSKQPKEGVVVDENILFGRNSVLEVLKSGRDIEKILVQKGQMEGSIKKIMGDAKQRGIVVQEVEKTKLDEMCNMEKHQGVVAYVSAHRYVEIDEILNDAKSKGEDPFILILENIQDPHNLGAIIRSAHNAGVHGIIISKRRAVGLTSTVSKASAGAIEYTKVAKVSNIAQTIEDLKAKGIWVACADMDGEIIYTDNLRGPIGIVIGSEGEGVSKLVKSKCDFVVRIPMYGKVTSLNASVAASILAYEVVRQRYF